MTCTCHPDSPFLWKKNIRPSIFIDMNKHTSQSAKQSEVVERMRNAGQDVSHIKGMSKSSRAQRITDFKKFTVYSWAVPTKK